MLLIRGEQVAAPISIAVDGDAEAGRAIRAFAGRDFPIASDPERRSVQFTLRPRLLRSCVPSCLERNSGRNSSNRPKSKSKSIESRAERIRQEPATKAQQTPN